MRIYLSLVIKLKIIGYVVFYILIANPDLINFWLETLFIYINILSIINIIGDYYIKVRI